MAYVPSSTYARTDCSANQLNGWKCVRTVALGKKEENLSIAVGAYAPPT